MLKGFATLAYLCLVGGVLLRKRRPHHPILMGSGIAIDTILVLTLQIQRSVIQGALTESYGLLERGHIVSSTIAFGLYFPVVALAVLRLRNKAPEGGRRWHMRLGITAFCFRTVGFMLMWAV